MRDLLPALGRMGVFLARILGAVRFNRMFVADTLHQLHVIGSRSVSIVAVGGAFVGLVLTLQGYRTLSTYGAVDALSTLLGLSLYRELAPVLTALLFIGRAGSSIAAELGLMRATDQIKALELMAIDPVAKAVAPRFWAAVLCVPLLTAFFCTAAFAASWFQAVQVLGIDNGSFWSGLRGSVDVWDDFGVSMLKSAVFGGIAALVQFGDWPHLAGVLAVWGVGQLLESYVLTPKLVGDRVGLGPVTVVFAVMAGGTLFGFLGMLLALPVASVANVLIRHLHGQYTASRFYLGDAPAKPGIEIVEALHHVRDRAGDPPAGPTDPA